MKILQLHVDYVEYYPVNKEIKESEENIIKEKKRYDETVVILISVEKDDDDKNIIQNFVKEVKIYLDKIKCDSILLYPYSHLSSNLESPKASYDLLKKIEKELIENLSGIKINRAPFGWTKELNLKIKGHPLAENSKTFIKNQENENQDFNSIIPNKNEINLSSSLLLH